MADWTHTVFVCGFRDSEQVYHWLSKHLARERVIVHVVYVNSDHPAQSVIIILHNNTGKS